MAIYHLSVKPVSRGAGRSATAAAAYRAAERILDHTTGQVFDYTRKSGVEHAEIVLPLDAAKRDINWARDRQQLWNAAEVAEKRKDARVAREYEVALPQELTKAQRLELTRTFSQELANRYGCAVDFAVHKPHRAGDDRNFHAHILTTTRQVEATGLGAKTAIEWADPDRAKRGLRPGKEEVAEIRERWAVVTNDKLRALGHEARVDHRSLEAQGIVREPTAHLGPAVSSMQRRGVATDVGERIEAEVQARLELAAEIGRLQREIEQVNRSIIELSTDVRAALTARDTGQSQVAAMRWDGEPRQTNEQLREAAREQWLEYREQRAGKGMGMGKDNDAEVTADRKKEHELPDDDFAL
ncbi:MAG: MobQ family relaxase [Burkholderiales bacterium]